ncbi:MAG: pyridoxamine 5'-phosphate oxidase family protein [Proteobacteria bacterium]|nr:pyridoxamine 5'-phosphate oxidase family protein [Pseudomonadota bacterium]
MAVDPELAAKMAPGFMPVPLARRLLRLTRSGTLATLMGEGTPFASLVSVATDIDGAPIILISGLSHHTRHILADARCSLLLAETGKGDPLAHPRLTLNARARRVDREGPEGERIRRRFLSRHPKAELYADFPDFGFWRLEPSHLYLNGGFARAWDGEAAEVLLPADIATAFDGLDAGATAHMNADHAAAVKLYATVLDGQEKGPWRVSGVDPEGIDLIAGERTARIAFPAVITEAGILRRYLAELAEKARRDA